MTNHPPQLDASFQREARIGLSVLATLIAIFLVVAYGKYSGWFQPGPVTFTAVVDEKTGIETLRPFSPFASVNTSDPRPAPTSTVTAGNVASENPPGDYQKPWRNSENHLVPSTTGSASVPTSDFVPQPIAPEFTTTPQIVTDSQPRIANDSVSERAGSFQPVAPQPKRMLPEELVVGTSAKSEGAEPPFPPPLRPSMNVIHDAPVQLVEMDSTKNAGTSSFAAAQSGPTSRPSGLTELPSLREPAIATDSSTKEFKSDSVEQVTFNQPEPETGDTSSMNRIITPESNLSEFQVEPLDTPAEGQATSIVSQDGDSFWLIAQRVYGDGRLFNALYEFNRSQVKSFNEIPVGTRISTPTLAELQEKWPQLCPRDSIFASATTDTTSIYTSIEGDTLFDIARDQLGQASRYLEIHQLNAEKLPADIGHATPLPAGVQITLPVQR